MIRISTLGSARIDIGAVSITPAAPKKFALLLRLGAERGRAISKTTLHELIYPEQSEANSRHSLREVIYQLRRAGAKIETDDYEVGMDSACFSVDYREFVASTSLSMEQIELASSGFLPGYLPLQSEAFQEWFDPYRASVSSDLSRALLRSIAQGRSTGDWWLAERAARACLAFDGANEEAILALAEMLALGGSKALAVDLLDTFTSEVGPVGSDLRLPAKILRRRISERPIVEHRHAHQARFVGRESAVASLHASLVAAKSGTGAWVVVSGEPGIGKTRLAREFCELSALEGAIVISTTLQPSDSMRPMSVFIDLVPHLLKLRGAIGCSPSSLRALQWLIALEGESGASDGMHDSDKPRHISVVEAIQDLLGAVASETPIVLLVEDTHWMDTPSLETVQQIFVTCANSQMLALMTTREPRKIIATLRHIDQVTHFPLRPLSRDATTVLTQELLRSLGSEASAATQRAIVDSSGGNPLFVISLASHCVRSGDQFAIPNTLRESLVRRVDGLTSRMLAVLATSVELGGHATARRLADALQMPSADLLSDVTDLIEQGLMASSDVSAMPSHPLISDALRERAPSAMLRLAAGRVGQVLEADADRLASPGLLWHAGESFLRAGDDARAFAALRNCAHHALGMGRPGDAAAILARACDLIIADAHRAQAARELITAADLAQEAELVLTGVQARKASGEATSHDQFEIAEIRAMVAAHRSDTEVEERLIGCLAAPDAPDSHRAQAALSLLKLADINGKPKLINLAVEAHEKLPRGEIDRFTWLEFQLIAAAATQDYQRTSERALELIAESERLPVSEMLRYHMNAAIALIKSGDVPQSLEVLTRVYGASDKTHCETFRLSSSIALAELYFDLYHDDAAEVWLSNADRVIENRNGPLSHMANSVLRIDWAICLKKYDEAARLFDAADHARVFGESAIGQRWRRAIRARINAELSTIDAGILAEAVAVGTTVAPSMSGVRDFEIACGCMALIKAGQHDDASVIIDRYIATERRSARPISRNLNEVDLLRRFSV